MVVLSERNQPIISVIMGVLYRRDSIFLLERAVQSILAQSFPDFELLICDDGSFDTAKNYLDTVAQKDVRLTLVRPGRCFSLPEKVNECLLVARGKYIARMDDDDYSHPDRFERQLAFLDAHLYVSFVGCNVDLYQDGTKVGKRNFPEYPSVKDFFWTQPYIHPSVMFRKECIEAVHGYSEDKRCILCEDYDLFLRLYAAGYTGANMQEVLFDYTVSSKAKGNAKMIHRWNEAVTRYRRFKELRVLPMAWPFVLKPLAVGLLPEKVLLKIKERQYRNGGQLHG